MSALLMISTAGSEKEARKIARGLVEDKIAACVNVITQITSFFFWNGKLCGEKEAMLFIKTDKRRIKELISKIKAMHSYNVPEIIFFEVDGGEKSYLQWIKAMSLEKDKKNNRKGASGIRRKATPLFGNLLKVPKKLLTKEK